MYSRDLAPDFHAGSASREAIDGLSAIAAALDHGISETADHGGSMTDFIAIMLGWGVLVAVIFYPALQLAAIATCVVFFCMRSFLRIVFGQPATPVEWQPGMPRHRQSFLRA